MPTSASTVCFTTSRLSIRESPLAAKPMLVVILGASPTSGSTAASQARTMPGGVFSLTTRHCDTSPTGPCGNSH